MKFRTLVIDPPWPLDVMGKRTTTNIKSNAWQGYDTIALPYATLKLDEIKALPIKSLTEKDAHLYLWVLNKFLPESYEIVRAWGFTPSQILTWCKRPMGLGLGGTFVNTTEHILFCRRGTLRAKRRVDTTWWIWKRQKKHSQKPDDFQELIESISPDPYLELFARRIRPGWAAVGNEIDGKDIRQSITELLD